jgi:hypothetical protein
MAPVVERMFGGFPDAFVQQRRERWHHEVHRFTLKTDERYRYLSGPFSGYLEISPEMFAARTHFSPSIAKPLFETKTAITEMIAELFRILYPDVATRVVTAETLKRHGFDPEAVGPDPDDYW